MVGDLTFPRRVSDLQASITEEDGDSILMPCRVDLSLQWIPCDLDFFLFQKLDIWKTKR